MKFIFLLLLSSLSWANIIVPKGLFKVKTFTNDREFIKEIVDVRSQQGIARKNELQSLGYNCFLIFSSNYSCKTVVDSKLNSEEKKFLKNLFITSELKFDDLDEYRQISSAPILTMTEIKQLVSVKLMNQAEQNIKIYIMKEIPQMTKLAIGNNEFIYDDIENKLTYIFEMRKTAGAITKTKFVSVEFKN